LSRRWVEVSLRASPVRHRKVARAMTAAALFGWIALGVGIQVALLMALAFSHHMQRYRELRRRVPQGDAVAAVPAENAASAVASWSGSRPFRVVERVIEDAAGTACSFHLAPEDGSALPAFLPGQFITLRLEPGDGPAAGRPLVRCYSLSDAPRADHYRITVKRIAAGAGTPAAPAGACSNFLHDCVQVGSVLQLRAPAGHFHLDAGQGPVVLIGGGIGITPMLSMLEWSLAQQPGREVWLFYGVRNSREHVMKQRLEALAATHANLRLHVCYSDPAAADRPGQDFMHRGRVGLALLRQLLPLRPFHYYVCGPAAMMATIVTELQQWGVPPDHLHSEAFGPASVPRAALPAMAPHAVETPGAATPVADAAGIAVRFARSGRDVTWSPGSGSLLELAEAHGIAVSSGCRAGGCGSCQTSIAAGEVTYRQVPDFDPEPGSCLLCVCTPRTAVTLEA
jgi:ferredoxin-NADP reductase